MNKLAYTKKISEVLYVSKQSGRAKEDKKTTYTIGEYTVDIVYGKEAFIDCMVNAVNSMTATTKYAS